MAQQIIDVGAAPNDPDADPARTAFSKCNDNFTELYGADTVNLSWDAATSTVVCSAGTNATLTVVDATNPGLMTSADKIKLDGLSGGGGGDVVGPASSTNRALSLFDGTTGKLLGESSWTQAAGGNMVAGSPLNMNGNNVNNLNDAISWQGTLLSFNVSQGGTAFRLVADSNFVNRVQIHGTPAGQGVRIRANSASEANIDIRLEALGLGDVLLEGGGDAQFNEKSLIRNDDTVAGGGSTPLKGMVALTLVEYQAIVTKDPNTIYCING